MKSHTLALGALLLALCLGLPAPPAASSAVSEFRSRPQVDSLPVMPAFLVLPTAWVLTRCGGTQDVRDTVAFTPDGQGGGRIVVRRRGHPTKSVPISRHQWERHLAVVVAAVGDSIPCPHFCPDCYRYTITWLVSNRRTTVYFSEPVPSRLSPVVGLLEKLLDL